MPAVARANGRDSVFSRTGAGRRCGSAMTTSTGPSSGTVYVNNTLLVVEGDTVGLHPRAGCAPDVSTLSTFSFTVFANSGKRVGRIGDQYTPDNTITSGSENVFCG